MEAVLDLGRLEEWANRNVLKLKSKYNFLHLGWTNLLEWDSLGTGSMGSSSKGRAVGAVEGSKLNMSQRCTPAGDSSFLLGGWGEMELDSTLHLGRTRQQP